MAVTISIQAKRHEGRSVNYRKVFGNAEPQCDVPGFIAQSLSQLFMGMVGTAAAGKVWYSSGDQNYLLSANRHGFVVTAMSAYSNECPLEIRPDDIWLSILTQFSTYMNANEAAVRRTILKRDGKEDLMLEYQSQDESSDDEIHADDVLRMFRRKITKQEFIDWAIPAFSTTSVDDQAAAAIVVMGQVKGYVNNPVQTGHGIPSVTLHGTKEDWKDILSRIEALPDYGDEPSRWFHLLRPVLQRFVNSFDDPDAKSTTDFWQKMIYQDEHLRGTDRYFGWISAFCFWNKNGSPPGYRRPSRRRADYHPLRLDGIEYHAINATALLPGYVSIPITVKQKSHDRRKFAAVIVAGLMGMAAKRRRSCTAIHPSEEMGIDRLAPVSAWFVFEKKDLQISDTTTDEMQCSTATTPSPFRLSERRASPRSSIPSVNTDHNTWQACLNSDPFNKVFGQSATSQFPYWTPTHQRTSDFPLSNVLVPASPFSPGSNLMNSPSISPGTALTAASLNTSAAASAYTPLRQQTPSQESVDIPTHQPFERPQFKQESPERELSPFLFSPTVTLHPLTGTELPMTHASIQHQMNVYLDRQTRQSGLSSQPSYMPLSSLSQTRAGRIPPSFVELGVTPEQEAYYLQYLELQKQAAWRRG